MNIKIFDFQDAGAMQRVMLRAFPVSPSFRTFAGGIV